MRQIESDDPVAAADEAFADFVAAEGQLLLRFAFLLTCGDGALAEDLLHSVLTRLADRGITDLDDPASYTRRSVVNEFRSHHRQLARGRGLTARLAVVADRPAPASAPEDRLAIFGALRELGERERSAIVLRYYEDLPDAEIATVLGCSRPTVRSLIHRAMPKLRSRLSGTYGPEGER